MYNFKGGQITDSGVLQLVKGCPNILQLELSSPKITDDGVLHISKHCNKIETIQLLSDKITDASLRFLADGSQLSSFSLIRKGCKKLRKLSVLNAASITDEGLTVLAQGCSLLGMFESPLQITSELYKTLKEYCDCLSTSVVQEGIVEEEEPEDPNQVVDST